MDRYIVNITDEALADMEALYEYIAKKLLAPENAMGQYNRIADAILTLDTYPDRFGLFECEPEHSMGIHRMIVEHNDAAFKYFYKKIQLEVKKNTLIGRDLL